MGLTQNVILVVHDWGSALGFPGHSAIPSGSRPSSTWKGSCGHFCRGTNGRRRHTGLLPGAAHAEGRGTDPREEPVHRVSAAAAQHPERKRSRCIAATIGIRRARASRCSTGPASCRSPASLRTSSHIVDAYARWLSTSPIPKLFIDAEPGGFLIGAQREFCRGLAQPGGHHQRRAFPPGEPPDEVGEAIARFVAKVLAGQIA